VSFHAIGVEQASGLVHVCSPGANGMGGAEGLADGLACLPPLMMGNSQVTCISPEGGNNDKHG